MDEFFDGFLEDFGPAFDRVYVPKSSMERYRGRLPDQLLKYWDEYGWCGYAEGMFWTVDPHEYEPALEAWIGGTPLMERDAYHVIARSAFGKLYLWGERTGFTLLIAPLHAFAMPCREAPTPLPDVRMQWFFGTSSKAQNDLTGLFAPALKKLGRLKASEMYAFVPAAALGGPETLEHLEKVKIVEHLVFLAQLSELRVFNPPDL